MKQSNGLRLLIDVIGKDIKSEELEDESDIDNMLKLYIRIKFLTGHGRVWEHYDKAVALHKWLQRRIKRLEAEKVKEPKNQRVLAQGKA